jgi:hypothetical protein
MFLACGAAELLCVYLLLCWLRWRYARHYGQAFRLMGTREIAEGWDHLRFSPRVRAYRLMAMLLIALGLLLIVKGVIT